MVFTTPYVTKNLLMAAAKWRTEEIGSAFPLDSKSNIEKDELIDSLQLRIGELLKNVEELSSAKNQIQYLKESIARQQEQFEQEKHELVATVENLEERIRTENGATETQTLQIHELGEENTILSSQVRELKQTLAEKQALFETTNRNLQSELDLRVSELTTTVSKRDVEIKKLKSHIVELKTKQTEQKSTIFQQRLETEKVKETISQLQADKQKQTERIQESKQKLQIRKEQITRIESTNRELSLQMASSRLDVQNVKRRETDVNVELQERDKEIESLKYSLRKALAIQPGFTTIESLASFVDKVQRERSAFEQEVIHACHIIKKLKRKLVESNNENESLKKELDVLRQAVSSQDKELEKLKTENNELRKMTSRQSTRFKAIPALEKTNVMLKGYLEQMNTAVRMESYGPSFKTLIELSIMLMRWRGLPGTEQVYAKDSRNWWWIGNGPDGQVNEMEVVTRVNSLTTQLDNAKKTIQEQQAKIGNLESKIEELESVSADAQAKCAKETDQAVTLREEVNALKSELELKVAADDHDAVVRELEATKLRLKQMKKENKENVMEVTNLQISLAKTKHQLNLTEAKNADLTVRQFLGTSHTRSRVETVVREQSQRSLSRETTEVINSERYRKKFDVPDHMIVEE